MSSLITEIKYANVLKLMERLDLHKLPTEQLGKLKRNKAYNVEDVFNRLIEVGAFKVNDLEFFKRMLDMAEGYSIDGEYMYRTGINADELYTQLQQAVSGHRVIDPDIED